MLERVRGSAHVHAVVERRGGDEDNIDFSGRRSGQRNVALVRGFEPLSCRNDFVRNGDTEPSEFAMAILIRVTLQNRGSRTSEFEMNAGDRSTICIEHRYADLGRLCGA